MLKFGTLRRSTALSLKLHVYILATLIIMAVLINMAMLYHPLPFVEEQDRSKTSAWITYPFSATTLDTFLIKSATPSGSPFLPMVCRPLVSQCTLEEPFGSFFSLRLGSGGRR